MTALIMAAQLILGLSILVILHEFGHYIAARAFGIKVEKFFLFFDAWNIKLFSFKKGDTEYGIGWLPLGGYVKIAGMIDESMDKEAMKKPAQPWEFRSKPAWQRLIVMIGGVVVNLILGIIIFAFVILRYEKQYLPNEEVSQHGIYASEIGKMAGFRSGDKIISINGNDIERFKDAQSVNVLFGSSVLVERDGQPLEIIVPDTFYKAAKIARRTRFIDFFNYPTKIDSLMPGMPAEKAGLMEGDHIIACNDIALTSYGDFRDYVSHKAGDIVSLDIIRQGDTLQKQLAVDSSGLVGIFTEIPYTLEDYSFMSAMKYGYKDAINMLVVNVKGFGKIFSGEEKATESLQGPIGIAKIYGGVWDWHKFWFITGLLSLILAFMNILPIPALDGGHVMFLLYEIVARRKPSDKFMEYAQMAGMIILLGIMAFAVGNDIFKLFQ